MFCSWNMGSCRIRRRGLWGYTCCPTALRCRLLPQSTDGSRNSWPLAVFSRIRSSPWTIQPRRASRYERAVKSLAQGDQGNTNRQHHQSQNTGFPVTQQMGGLPAIHPPVSSPTWVTDVRYYVQPSNRDLIPCQRGLEMFAIVAASTGDRTNDVVVLPQNPTCIPFITQYYPCDFFNVISARRQYNVLPQFRE